MMLIFTGMNELPTGFTLDANIEAYKAAGLSLIHPLDEWEFHNWNTEEFASFLDGLVEWTLVSLPQHPADKWSFRVYV